MSFPRNRGTGSLAHVETRAAFRANGFVVVGVDCQNSVGSSFDGASAVVGERSIDSFDEQNAAETGIVGFFVTIVGGDSFVFVEITEFTKFADGGRPMAAIRMP